MDVRNPFGLRDGKFITIADISEGERGRNCRCVCPNCNVNFIARVGKKRRPHFAHDGEPCDIVKAILTAMYKALQEAVTEIQSFSFPDCWISAFIDAVHRPSMQEVCRKTKLYSYEAGDSDCIIKRGKFGVESSTICTNTKDIPTAIILTDNRLRHQLAVVIVPPSTLCKVSEPKAYKNMPTLAIRLPDEMDVEAIKAADLKRMLCEEIRFKEWVSSPLVAKWQVQKLDSLNRGYQIFLDEQEKRHKQAIELRKKQAEQSAQQMKKWYEAIVVQAQQTEKEQEWQRQLGKEHEAEQLRKTGQMLSEMYTEIPEDKPVVVNGRRWCYCTLCGSWHPDYEMAMYGGRGKNRNTGQCSDCLRSRRS